MFEFPLLPPLHTLTPCVLFFLTSCGDSTCIGDPRLDNLGCAISAIHHGDYVRRQDQLADRLADEVNNASAHAAAYQQSRLQFDASHRRRAQLDIALAALAAEIDALQATNVYRRRELTDLRHKAETLQETLRTFRPSLNADRSLSHDIQELENEIEANKNYIHNKNSK